MWRQARGNFEPSVAFSPAITACTGSSELASCVDKFVRAHHGPQALRASDCVARATTRCSAPDWRVALERRVAATAGIPVLRSWEARIQRHDAHPGLQYGGRATMSSNFDCSHSSLGDGVYDPEVSAFFDVVDKHWPYSPTVDFHSPE